MTEEKRDLGYITISEIQKLLKDYRIGKKPLAKLLGWGETTIIRYMDGDIPTIEYSNKLKEILYNPCYFYQILLENKDNLTNIAYKKSKQSVLEKIMETKINVVTQYIVNEYKADICAAQIQNLLYYVQGFSLALRDAPMFQDEYTITEVNVPFPQIYQDMRSRVVICLELKENLLSSDEKELIDSVIDAFSWYGPKALKSMASFEKTMLRISRDKDNRKVITKDIIKSYFSDIVKQYSIKKPCDIYKYPDARLMDLKQLS